MAPGQPLARLAQDPIWKQTEPQKTGDMTQEVECLPSNYKTLSSIPSTAI
jgi:hypothetical protein